MKFFISFFLLIINITGFGQLAKGDWMINGNGYIINQSDGQDAETTIFVGITPGYFFLDRWLVGGRISLNLTEDNTLVSNEAFLRYYFKDSLSRKKLFVEGRWEKRGFSPIGIGLSDRRLTSNEFILAGGLNYFITQFLALEMKVDYKFIRRYKAPKVAVQRFDPIFEFNIGLQYFFRYKDVRETVNRDFRDLLQKGNWLLRGDFNVSFKDEVENRNIQSMNAGLGIFVKKNLAFGGSMYYSATRRYNQVSVGLGPFMKYYMNVGKQKKLFALSQIEYGLYIVNSGTDRRAVHQVNYGLGFGFSNFINEQVSFDIGYRFNWYSFYRSFISDKTRSTSDQGLILGLNYFIIKNQE